MGLFKFNAEFWMGVNVFQKFFNIFEVHTSILEIKIISLKLQIANYHSMHKNVASVMGGHSFEVLGELISFYVNVVSL